MTFKICAVLLLARRLKFLPCRKFGTMSHSVVLVRYADDMMLRVRN
jgi:hypothetical protein